MKRGNPDLFRPEAYDLIHTLPHLPRRFICKGNRHDLIRVHAFLIDQVCHSVGEHPGLTRSCARQNEHRSFCLHDRLLLPVI